MWKHCNRMIKQKTIFPLKTRVWRYEEFAPFYDTDDYDTIDFEDLPENMPAMKGNITLLVKRTKIVVSKLLLIEHSDYFRAMFCGNFLESNQHVVRLKETEPNALKDTILLLEDEEGYFSKIRNIAGVLDVCKKFMFTDLHESICLRLKNSLNSKNCLVLYCHLKDKDAFPYRKNAISMALTNFDEIVRDKVHLLMRLEDIRSYFGCVYLQCKSEMDVFLACVNWLEERVKSESEHAVGDEIISVLLLICIDANHASIDELQKMYDHNFVQKHRQTEQLMNMVLALKRSKEYMDCEMYIREKIVARGLYTLEQIDEEYRNRSLDEEEQYAQEVEEYEMKMAKQSEATEKDSASTEKNAESTENNSEDTTETYRVGDRLRKEGFYDSYEMREFEVDYRRSKAFEITETDKRKRRRLDKEIRSKYAREFMVEMDDNTHRKLENKYQQFFPTLSADIYLFNLAYMMTTCRQRYLPKQLGIYMRDFGMHMDGSSNKDKRRDNLVLYNKDGGRMSHLFDINSKVMKNLVGGAIETYRNRLLIFGGQSEVGKGAWNPNVYCYNLLNNKCWRVAKNPYRRRHFRSCAINHYLFMIGGYGEYRIVQDTLIWFDLLKREWSPEIKLPVPPTQLLCCEWNKQLFIYSIPEKIGYKFDENTSEFHKVEIVDEDNLLTENSFYPTCVFVYNDLVYLKGRELVTMDINDNVLEVIKVTEMPHFRERQCVQAFAIANEVYSLYKEETDDGDKVTIEHFNVDTSEFKFLVEFTTYPNFVHNYKDLPPHFNKVVGIFAMHKCDLIEDTPPILYDHKVVEEYFTTVMFE